MTTITEPNTEAALLPTLMMHKIDQQMEELRKRREETAKELAQTLGAGIHTVAHNGREFTIAVTAERELDEEAFKKKLPVQTHYKLYEPKPRSGLAYHPLFLELTQVSTAVYVKKN